MVCAAFPRKKKTRKLDDKREERPCEQARKIAVDVRLEGSFS
jgi:hypothetical protein